jgi:hypothetical protein
MVSDDIRQQCQANNHGRDSYRKKTFAEHGGGPDSTQFTKLLKNKYGTWADTKVAEDYLKFGVRRSFCGKTALLLRRTFQKPCISSKSSS